MPTANRITGIIVEMVYSGQPNNAMMPMVHTMAALITKIGKTTPRTVRYTQNKITTRTASSAGIMIFMSVMACTVAWQRPAGKTASMN